MRIDVNEITEELTKLKTWLSEHSDKINTMNTGVQTFTTESTSTFVGEAGDGMRACMTDVFTPLNQQFITTEQVINQSIDTITQNAQSEFGGSGIVDEAYLDEWMNDMKRVVRQYNEACDDIDSGFSSVSDLISVSPINRDGFSETEYNMVRHITQLKDKMHEFESMANAEVARVNDEASKFLSMAKEASSFNGDMASYKAGSFKFSALTMSRKKLSMSDLSEAERTYVENLQKQFGFNEEEALLMMGVYKGLQDKYPNESEKDIARRFTRLMSQTTYDGWQWDTLAGGGELRDEMKSMGFEDGDIQFLEDTIHMNYRGTSDGTEMKENTQEQIERLRSRYPGMSDDEIAEMYRQRFHDKNDFPHQMIVTAVDLNYVLGPDSNPAGTSGYIGDIRGVWATRDRENAGMDNPDYKADLDGYNIAVDQRTDSNKSFLDVSNDYYNRIDPSKQENGHEKTRATEFLYHKGYEDERKYGPFGNYNKSYEDYVNQGVGRVEWEINRNGYKENWGNTDESKKFMDAVKNHQNEYR